MKRGKKWRENVLACDLFAGDKEGVDLWLRDKIVTARKAGECRECGGPIEPGTLVRSMAFKDDGEIVSGRVCQDCCDAAAISWKDDGEALEGRFQLLMERRGQPPALVPIRSGEDGQDSRSADPITPPSS